MLNQFLGKCKVKPLHTHKNGENLKDSQQQVLARIRAKWNTPTLLVRIENDAEAFW